MPHYALKNSKQKAHNEAVWAVRWIPFEEKGQDALVTGSLDETAILWWDAVGSKDGNPAPARDDIKAWSKIEGQSLSVIGVDVVRRPKAPADKRITLCTASMDGYLRLYSVNRNNTYGATLLLNIEADGGQSWVPSLHPTRQLVASGSSTGSINIWDTSTPQKQPMQLDTHSGSFVFSAKFSPEHGEHIACACANGEPYMFDVNTSKELRKFEPHSKPIRALEFSPDARRILTASEDMHVNVYDSLSGQQVTNIPAHSSWVTDISVCPVGGLDSTNEAVSGDHNFQFASCGSDKLVKIWDFRSLGQAVHVFSSHTDQVWSVDYSPDGTKLASVGDDATLNVYDTHQE